MIAKSESAAPSAQTAPPQLREELSPSPADALALVILWSAREPHRVGELALLPAEVPTWVFGRAPEQGQLESMDKVDPMTGAESLRAAALDGARSPKLGVVRFIRQRPDGSLPGSYPSEPIAGEAISRLQLHLSHREEALFVRNVGRCPLLVDGRSASVALVQPGSTLYLRNQLLLLCTRRPLKLPALRAYPKVRLGEFGAPDLDGMIGESPAIWNLRDRLAVCARSAQNVLIVGESGSGKELAAQAIHSLSSRHEKPLVTDNISAIPPSLAAALLFGNKRGFPNPGMEERIGLIGAADGSMLFLDEIGDMPEEVQPMFLRVAERRGEYFRLGEEGRIRRSDFRLLGATNRPERMRYELKRRFQREIRVPSLNERKEDIPLLIRHLLQNKARQGDLNALAFFDTPEGLPQVHPLLVDQLVRHSYITNVSEVEFLLGHAMAESVGPTLGPIPGPLPVQGRSMSTPAAAQTASPPRRRPASTPPPSAERAQRALDESSGNVQRAATALGISRHQMNRMIGRYSLTRRRLPQSGPQDND